jgi:hypothetical protein
MLAQSPKHPGHQGALKGRSPSGSHLQGPPEESEVPSLEELRISKNQSSQAQQLASVPKPAFERILVEAKEEGSISGGKLIQKAVNHGVLPRRPVDPQAEAKARKKARLNRQRSKKRAAQRQREEAECQARYMTVGLETRFGNWNRGLGLPRHFHPEERDAFLSLLREAWAGHFDWHESA